MLGSTCRMRCFVSSHTRPPENLTCMVLAGASRCATSAGCYQRGDCHDHTLPISTHQDLRFSSSRPAHTSVTGCASVARSMHITAVQKATTEQFLAAACIFVLLVLCIEAASRFLRGDGVCRAHRRCRSWRARNLIQMHPPSAWV